MSYDDEIQDEGLQHQPHTRTISRSQLLAAAAAGVAVVAVPHGAEAQTPPATENPQDIINIRVTAEYFGVTFLSMAVKNQAQLGLNTVINNVKPLDAVQAALIAEQYHLDYLVSVGAKPLTTTFTIPDPKMLTDAVTFFSTVELIEVLEIGADMSATRQFSQLGNRMMAQVHYQIGATEAEHRVVARATLALLGQAADVPPNNKAFETDTAFYLADFLKMYTAQGFIGGSGMQVTYPGRDAALAAGGPMLALVTDKTP